MKALLLKDWYVLRKQAWAYLEGFRDGASFMREAKRMTQCKPMLLIKANRGKAGAKASASHSASLAANDAVCDQLLRNVSPPVT